MFRRNFIQLAAIGPVTARARRTVTYRIEGFSCVTCAVGLDAMLRDRKGVIRSKSSYSDKRAAIEFDPDLVAEATIKAYISEMGFVPSEISLT